MITQSQFQFPSLRRGLAWLFFCTYYPKRKPNENGSRYYRKRRAAFEARHPSSTIEDKPHADSPA